jgi:hypothetical protein
MRDYRNMGIHLNLCELMKFLGQVFSDARLDKVSPIVQIPVYSEMGNETW